MNLFFACKRSLNQWIVTWATSEGLFFRWHLDHVALILLLLHLIVLHLKYTDIAFCSICHFKNNNHYLLLDMIFQSTSHIFILNWVQEEVSMSVTLHLSKLETNYFSPTIRSYILQFSCEACLSYERLEGILCILSFTKLIISVDLSSYRLFTLFLYALH